MVSVGPPVPSSCTSEGRSRPPTHPLLLPSLPLPASPSLPVPCRYNPKSEAVQSLEARSLDKARAEAPQHLRKHTAANKQQD